MAVLERARRVGKKYFNPVPTTVGGASMIPKVMVEYIRNRAERTPREPLGPFKTDAGLYQTLPASGLRVTWMGHSTSLMEIDGMRVLIDPVWDERAAPVEWFGPKRFFAAPLALDELPAIDVVLLSHDHYDHLGAGTMRRLASLAAVSQARWVTTLGVGSILGDFGIAPARVTELDWTDSVKVGSLQITALPARHFSGRSLFNRFQTLWASFALGGSEHKVFYGADSGEWEGFGEIGRQYGPFDLTMLEIGAFNTLWADIHMGPDGAARTYQAMGAHGLLMPIHWGLFDLALHGWREPIERMFAIDGLTLWAPEPGLPTEVERGVEVRSAWWRR